MRPLVCGVLPALLLVGCGTPTPARFVAVPAASTNLTSLPEPVGDLPPPKTKPAKPAAKPASTSAKSAGKPALLVTPSSMLTGRVTSFNATGRFVVLNFPVGHLPAMDQRMDVYHQGVKIGEVKITGPQRDDHIVADVTEGEAQAGDEVRAR